MSEMASTLNALDDASLAECERSPRARRRPSRVEFSRVNGGEPVTTVIVSPKLMVSAAIVRPRRVFRLRGTFVIDTQEIDDGTIFVRHRDLPVYGYGETLVEALAGFYEMFEMQWQDLVEGDATLLSEEAKDVRERFRAIVGSVDPR